MRLLGHEWYAVYDGYVTSSVSVRTISMRGVFGDSITISAPQFIRIWNDHERIIWLVDGFLWLLCGAETTGHHLCR